MLKTLKKPKQDTGGKRRNDIDLLNKKYLRLTPEQRIRELHRDFDKVLLTSSFGTTAVYLLWLYQKAGIRQPVYFIDTTFHFDETLEYKAVLTKLFDLEVIHILPDKGKNKTTKNELLWQYDPDECCRINKVEPLERIKAGYDVWVSGLMSWQSSHRMGLDTFVEKNGMLRFYPILDVKEDEVLRVIEENNLPVHPLKPLGYESIGCKYCTLKGKKRKGRWAQTIKTECGLHL